MSEREVMSAVHAEVLRKLEREMFVEARYLESGAVKAAINHWYSTRASRPALAQGDELREAVTEAIPKLAALREIVWGGRSGQPYFEIASVEMTMQQALSAQREQPQGECKCSMSIRLLGDGCQYCNPELAAELAAEAAEDAEEQPQGVGVPSVRARISELCAAIDSEGYGRGELSSVEVASLIALVDELRALLGQREG